MPPAAVTNDYLSPLPLCCGAFDIGEIEIEVQAVDGDITSVKSTQIVVSPGYNDDLDGNCTNGALPYLQSRLCLADSFDNSDEIIEGSNEMKLMKRVVNKQRANSKNENQHQGGGGHHQQFGQQNALLQRQDSMSDTNSVNSNDVFISIDDSKEMEYLDVLDQHVNQVNREALENETEDSHPNQQKHETNLDDIIEHLCAAPCVACLPDVDTLIEDSNTPGGYPKSVLRKPRYSSSDQYLHSSVHRNTNDGIRGQPIFIRSSSDYDPTSSNNNKQELNSVRFQNVDIRLLKMTLGNHPSATTGPPVMLDGELADPIHLARQIMTLEKYEQTRPPRRKRRQLKLSLQQRHNILVKERGFSFEEVKGAWQQSLEIRRQRKETLDRGLSMMKWDEVWESTCRKFNRLVDVTL